MFHYCGGLDDIPFFILYLLMLIPGIRLMFAWARRKLKRDKKPDCCDCHKE